MLKKSFSGGREGSATLDMVSAVRLGVAHGGTKESYTGMGEEDEEEVDELMEGPSTSTAARHTKRKYLPLSPLTLQLTPLFRSSH